ncbi:MAG: polysaccharide lyase 6 family protein [Paludibacter sp.]
MRKNAFGLIYLCFSFFISTNLLLAQKTVLVQNALQLNSAISNAKAGDVLLLKNGEWKDVQIDLKCIANAQKPITLRAEKAGKVIFTGNSSLTFSKPYLIADGLYFKCGKLDGGSVINFNADYCRLTNSAIVDYNPDKFDTNYYWIYLKGSYNRIDHCFLKGKNNMNPVLGNDNENSRYNKVDSCYIKDIPYVPKANGREIFRIWGYGHDDQTGNDGAYFTIEYNLFDHADGEGTEIVSLKSNYNVVRFNTVIASRGGLVGRRGKFNTFDSNIILGQGVKGSTGIRVAGANHKVINNYVSEVSEDGLRLIAGEYYEESLTSSFAPKKKQLPKYLQVQNGYFGNNSIIYCGGHGIDIGYSYKNDWPDLQMVLLPENNNFVNNVVYNCKGNSVNIAFQDKQKPLNIFEFKPNTFNGNIVWGSKVNVTPMPTGIKMALPKFKMDKNNIIQFDLFKNNNIHVLTPKQVGVKWKIN